MVGAELMGLSFDGVRMMGAPELPNSIIAYRTDGAHRSSDKFQDE
jgi:hypothetical protein